VLLAISVAVPGVDPVTDASADDPQLMLFKASIRATDANRRASPPSAACATRRRRHERTRRLADAVELDV
jgi:hypothetical protein